MHKILHVDDEKDIRSIAKLSLQSIGGFEVTSCESGREALGCLEAVSPDCILLDVMMPDLDGPATLLELRRRQDTVDIPVIFMTAETDAREVERLIELGAIGVIAKPFNPMQLSEEIKRVWTDWKSGTA
ncbi:response regulator [Nisaea acidiphila]|uniref:Response regulator n=1 Tax=Nisaea acidiphila TaxID=1862145 RepID=A0A9J7AT34_9PROT|nr:response regulator [Nisaea acidiphila]UUX50334.1 response regulator [Nisaea acidiphila]